MTGKSFLLKLLAPLLITSVSVAKVSPEAIPLKVISFEYYPYIQAKPGPQGRGLVLDILEKALANTRFKANFEFYPLKRAILMESQFKKNGWPIFVGSMNHMAKIPERKLLTAVPLGAISYHLYLRKSDQEKFKNLKNLADFTKHSVVVSEGSAITSELNRLGIKYVEVSTLEQLFRMLTSGRVDAAIAVELTGEFYAQTEEFKSKVMHLPSPVHQITLDVIVPKEHPYANELVQDLKSEFSKLYKSGELRKIAEKYYGEGSVPEGFFRPL